jgi:choline transport protein
VSVPTRLAQTLVEKNLTRQFNAVFWSLTAWIATSAVILATAPKTNAEFVFTQFTNETGWPDGVAWILGLLQSALSLIGYDAVTHMTEEMPRPTRDAPIAMITCVAIGGVT